MRAVIQVVLPLSMTGIAVAALFSFLLSWDEFIYASYLTLAKVTMPLKVYYYVARGNLFFSATYAVIITIPVLILTFALQKYIRPEYLSGAVKG
jgi:trehalose transport system permease protein